MDTEMEQENGGSSEGGETELDSLQRENENLGREVKLREAAISRLEQISATQNAEIEVLKKSLDEVNQKQEDLGKSLARAIAAYRELLAQANPGLLAELITGDTIEAVEESLKKARSLMERVRQEIEAEAARTKIPAGAPQRAALDLSALTAREKIQYAIGGFSS